MWCPSGVGDKKNYNPFMMKRLLSLLALVMISSAAFAQRIERIEYQESSARTLESDQKMFMTPMIADLEVSPTRITHVEREAFANLEITPEVIKAMATFKSVALSHAARAFKADVIVGTTIDVRTNNVGRLEITVTGYPASYRNFRIAQRTELELIEYANTVHTGSGNSLLDTPESRIEIVK